MLLRSIETRQPVDPGQVATPGSGKPGGRSAAWHRASGSLLALALPRWTHPSGFYQRTQPVARLFFANRLQPRGRAESDTRTGRRTVPTLFASLPRPTPRRNGHRTGRLPAPDRVDGREDRRIDAAGRGQPVLDRASDLGGLQPRSETARIRSGASVRTPAGVLSAPCSDRGQPGQPEADGTPPRAIHGISHTER